LSRLKRRAVRQLVLRPRAPRKQRSGGICVGPARPAPLGEEREDPAPGALPPRVARDGRHPALLPPLRGMRPRILPAARAALVEEGQSGSAYDPNWRRNGPARAPPRQYINGQRQGRFPRQLGRLLPGQGAWPGKPPSSPAALRLLLGLPLASKWRLVLIRSTINSGSCASRKKTDPSVFSRRFLPAS
jgi:hypothetical protein